MQETQEDTGLVKVSAAIAVAVTAFGLFQQNLTTLTGKDLFGDVVVGASAGMMLFFLGKAIKSISP